MSRALRLLMSARDHGAAENIAAIARRGMARSNIEIMLVSMLPATDFLRELGLDPHGLNQVIARNRADPAAPQLLAMARQLVRQFEADAVLVGLSGQGAGIDEALLAEGPAGQCYALQDYWGDVNLRLDRAPDCMFVAREEAARLTLNRVDTRAVVTGTPKYERMARLDMPSLRRAGRVSFGVADDRPILGIFLQQLRETPGYGAQWEAVAEAASALPVPPIIVVRPHPGDKTAFPVLQAKIAEVGLSCRDASSLPLDSVLAACDLVCSAYSTVGEDYLNMLRFAPSPLGSVRYLMADAVYADFKQRSGLEAPPPCILNLARMCLVGAGVAAIGAELAAALSPSVRMETWRAARDIYRDQGGAADRILDEICAGVSAAATLRGAAFRSRA